MTMWMSVAGNLNALMLAATNNHVETIKVLHGLGADVNARTNDESGNQAAYDDGVLQGTHRDSKDAARARRRRECQDK